MARTELDIKKHKRKAKKRKHDMQTTGSEDEVANKSLIVEEQDSMEKETEKLHQNGITKSLENSVVEIAGKLSKRKHHPENSVIKGKRSKPNDDSKQSEADEEDLNDMPTSEQLEEAAKPENLSAIVTVRQKKKNKHLQRLEVQKDQNADKESKRNEEYLRKWLYHRKNWKFEKLRQISIQQTAFNEKKLSADVWPIALAYLAGSKGAAKATICNLAEEAIQEMDKQCDQLSDDVERQAIVESTRYQRARDLLQSFD